MSDIKENDLGDRMALGLPYGTGGGIGMSNLDTFRSPDVSQDPNKFKYNQVISNVAVTNPTPDEFEPVKEPKKVTDKDVNKLKTLVTPDEIVTGIDAELKKQLFKNKELAKARVIINLRKDPKYYSKLKFLGIDTDEKNKNENRKYMTHREKVICDIMADLKEQKDKKRTSVKLYE